MARSAAGIERMNTNVNPAPQLTGTREMDASAIIDYFKPLEAWLEEENKGQDCGWD